VAESARYGGLDGGGLCVCGGGGVRKTRRHRESENKCEANKFLIVSESGDFIA
jgi:hypothetical protein